MRSLVLKSTSPSSFGSGRDGLPFSAKSRFALWRLPEALDLPADVVVQVVADTERLFAERQLEAEEQRRLAREAEDAAWRARFLPHP